MQLKRVLIFPCTLVIVKISVADTSDMVATALMLGGVVLFLFLHIPQLSAKMAWGNQFHR